MISVVVPARNAGALLGGQLAALCAQTYDGDWEVIVADNGSSDNTAEVARSFTGRLPAVRVAPAGRVRGPGAARNAGVSAAAGELLAFCDADDRVDPGWLAACAGALADADVVAGATDITTLADPPEEETRYYHAGLLSFLPAGLGANLAARRQAFLSLGGFDEGMRVGEDIDFCWRSQLAGLRFAEAPDALVVKRVPVTTLEILRKTFRYGRSDVDLYRRYRSMGMPRQLERSLSVPKWLARHAPLLLREDGRKQWAWQGGTYAGRMVGSFEHRVLYP